MHVWLVKLEESVPTDVNFRPYRMSMLASALIDAGHSVTRWCSDFDHVNKMPRFGKAYIHKVSDSYTINFIHTSISYTKPVSFRRLLNNFLVQNSFVKQSGNSVKPDVIVCSMPTPAMAKASSEIAAYYGIPLIIDARDMWPDIIEKELSGWRFLVSKPMIFTMRKSLREACEAAFSCVGITKFYKDFLLSYANREESPLDAVFELGYQKDENKLSLFERGEVELFWKEKGVEFDKEEKIIYFAGRLNSTVFNVFEVVLDAARELFKLQPNFKFVICGSGQYFNEIKLLSAGCENIIVPGEINSTELVFLREHSFVALQPIERREDYQNSLSNKFFEYISCGLPILTWLDGITEREITEHNCGFKFNSSQDLVHFLIKLNEDLTTYNSMRLNSKKLFDTKYNSKMVYENFANHIEYIHKEFFIQKLEGEGLGNSKL